MAAAGRSLPPGRGRGVGRGGEIARRKRPRFFRLPATARAIFIRMKPALSQLPVIARKHLPGNAAEHGKRGGGREFSLPSPSLFSNCPLEILPFRAGNPGN
jgi:hypothetical protein